MDEDLEILTKCHCRKCEGEFFQVFKNEAGAHVVVCCDCGETNMCQYAMEASNDT